MIDGKRKGEMAIRSGAGENFLFFALYYFLMKRGKNINRKVGMMIMQNGILRRLVESLEC